jgi:nucleotide-binding universal stress UspA family protein
MVSYRNILFCTDFSENAQSALPYAIDLTKRYGAMLHLLHVYQEPAHVAEFEISSNIKMDWIRVAHLMGTEMEKKLKALCDAVSREVGSCQSKIFRGRPHSEILRYAKEASIDLIVMASHGLTGWEHVLFGSTTERVLRESPCHVLVIRRPG